MSAWTKQEELDLTAMVRANRSWVRIAGTMPGRSQLSCQSKARRLRLIDSTRASSEREYSGKHGRPRFKAPRLKLGFRLDRAVRDRFVAIARALGLRPGVLLLQSLERVGRKCGAIELDEAQWDALTALLGARAGVTELTEAEVKQQVQVGDHVAVSWCVPEQEVLDAAARIGEELDAVACKAGCPKCKRKPSTMIANVYICECGHEWPRLVASHYATAERAVIEALQEYGYRITT